MSASACLQRVLGVLVAEAAHEQFRAAQRAELDRGIQIRLVDIGILVSRRQAAGAVRTDRSMRRRTGGVAGEGGRVADLAQVVAEVQVHVRRRGVGQLAADVQQDVMVDIRGSQQAVAVAGRRPA